MTLLNGKVEEAGSVHFEIGASENLGELRPGGEAVVG